MFFAREGGGGGGTTSCNRNQEPIFYPKKLHSQMIVWTWLFSIYLAGHQASAFVMPPLTSRGHGSAQAAAVHDSSENEIQPAQELLERARKLREEIGERQAETRPVATKPVAGKASPWSLCEESSNATAYRLYVDIGREEGTWMDPRWGASGQRMELSLDVAFTTQKVNRTVAEMMVQDNMGGSASPVYHLETAPYARLRGGFDRMKCESGAYRVDTPKPGQRTLRLFFQTQGKAYGDVSLPEDSNLYISLPVLADTSLSRKEGIVSVRQFGWHTGWYREESRIVGVVRAVPLEEARKRDKF